MWACPTAETRVVGSEHSAPKSNVSLYTPILSLARMKHAQEEQRLKHISIDKKPERDLELTLSTCEPSATQR